MPDVRILGLQEGEEGEDLVVAKKLLKVQASPVRWSNSSKSETENSSASWTFARLPQARRRLEAGRLCQRASSCDQMPQSQGVLGLIV